MYTGWPSTAKGSSNSADGALGDGTGLVSSAIRSQSTTNSSPPNRATRSWDRCRRRAAGDLGEEAVPGGVAQPLVHHLEAVEADGEDRTEALVGAGCGR